MLSPAMQLVSHKWLILHCTHEAVYVWTCTYLKKQVLFSSCCRISGVEKREHSHDSISKCPIQPSSSKVCVHMKDLGVFSTYFRSQGTHACRFK